MVNVLKFFLLTNKMLVIIGLDFTRDPGQTIRLEAVSMCRQLVLEILAPIYNMYRNISITGPGVY